MPQTISFNALQSPRAKQNHLCKGETAKNKHSSSIEVTSRCCIMNLLIPSRLAVICFVASSFSAAFVDENSSSVAYKSRFNFSMNSWRGEEARETTTVEEGWRLWICYAISFNTLKKWSTYIFRPYNSSLDWRASERTKATSWPSILKSGRGDGYNSINDFHLINLNASRERARWASLTYF